MKQISRAAFPTALLAVGAYCTAAEPQQVLASPAESPVVTADASARLRPLAWMACRARHATTGYLFCSEPGADGARTRPEPAPAVAPALSGPAAPPGAEPRGPRPRRPIVGARRTL